MLVAVLRALAFAQNGPSFLSLRLNIAAAGGHKNGQSRNMLNSPVEHLDKISISFLFHRQIELLEHVKF